jgi:hypothetical protein
MTDQNQPEEVTYPPAPWRLKGQMWMAIYDTGTPVALPDGFKPLLNPNWLAIVLVRYLEGTLRYDELVVGTVAYRGLRVGIHVHSLWVNDEASLWGGRRIWGVPKELATFTWDSNTVHVLDKGGPIVTLTVNGKAPRAPWVWMLAPGFGFLDGRCLHILIRTQVRLGRAGIRVDGSSPRFPYRIAGTPLFGLTGDPIRITVPEPRILD